MAETLDEAGQDWTELSYEEAKQILRTWREDHERRAEETVEIWEHVLSSYSSSLGDELWPVLEQVCIASLDCNRQDLALDCLQTLNKQFPGSSRVTKLQALRLESIGKYADADRLYSDLIKADETNLIFRKRRIAILIAKGERLEAIKELNEYLNNFINDSEAWTELGELYLLEGDMSRAVFCFEEVILSSPNNGALYTRLGELRYTIGNAENLEIARTYFEKAIKLNVGARALYGYVLTANALLGKSAGQKRRDLVTSAQDAIEKLTVIYSEKGENPTLKHSLKLIQSLKTQFV